MAENGATVLVMKIMVIVVAVLMIATVAIPATESAKSSMISVEQNSAITYAVTSSDNVNIQIVYTSNDDITVAGYHIPVVNARKFLAINDAFTVFWAPGFSKLYIMVEGHEYSTVGTVTIANGTVSFTNESNQDISFDYTGTVMYAAQHGTYGEFIPGAVVNFDADAVFYVPLAFNGTNSDLDPSTVYVTGLISGTYDDLDTVFTKTTGQTVTASFTATDGNGFKTMTVGTFTLTMVNSTGTYTGTQSAPILAPIVYHATNTDMINLISIIPILLIIVPVMMAVRMMAGKSN